MNKLVKLINESKHKDIILDNDNILKCFISERLKLDEQASQPQIRQFRSTSPPVIRKETDILLNQLIQRESFIFDAKQVQRNEDLKIKE